jgi:hypothetical protein
MKLRKTKNDTQQFSQARIACGIRLLQTLASMIAIEIRHNGELKATCGLDEFRQLTAMLSVSSNGTSEPDCDVECMGLRAKDEDTDEIVRWVKKRVAIGDEVSFKVVETNTSQEPFDSQIIPKYADKQG